MNIVAIVQARMTSTRFPGKVLVDLLGAPMLERVVERARTAERLTGLWVACTDGASDDPIMDWCRRSRVPVFRGSERDVLGRFVGTARAADADVIVRLTADCPLIDGSIIDRVVDTLVSRDPPFDYAANVLARTFPRGLDVEAFTRVALERMDHVGTSRESREHVTIPARLEHRELFTIRSVTSDTDDSDLRFTVDTPDDLEFVRLLYRSLRIAERPVGSAEIIEWCRTNPAVARQDDHETWDPSRSLSTGTTGGNVK